jgi:hypothetical protein
METLRTEETTIRGYWLDLGSRMVPDSGWERINQLTERLELLATSADGATKLYRDPADGRLWERTPISPALPQGPPLMTVITEEQARAVYPQAFTS